MQLKFVFCMMKDKIKHKMVNCEKIESVTSHNLYPPSPCHKLSHFLRPPPPSGAWHTLWTAPYYRRPYHDLEAFLSITSVTECLEILYDTDATVILLWDFNMPSINWLVSDKALYKNSFFSWDVNNCEIAFMKFVQTHALKQLVVEPTRSNSILDLILVCSTFNQCWSTI